MILLHNPLQLEISAFAIDIADKLSKPFREEIIDIAHVDDYCESNDVDMLVMTCLNKAKDIQALLNSCRNLRIPYIIITPDMHTVNLSKQDNVLIPVSMFEEELSKAQIATSFGRFCHTNTILLQAKDYGTRAAKNIGRISTLIEKFELPYTVHIGKSDSYKIEKEATLNASQFNAKLLVISASRDYGIDDLLFGPKERHIVQKATVPVILLNPRGDLYSLCD